MGTTALWLILAVTVALVVVGSCLFKRRFTVKEIALIGVMAALSFVAFTFFKIPFMGSYFHLGNTFVALAALLLDGVCGGLAGAVGLSLGDIISGSPDYAVTTFLLKFIIGVVCGITAHRLFRLKEKKPGSKGYLPAVTMSALSGLLVNVVTDPLFGYFRRVYLLGQEYTIAQVMAKITAGVTLVNSLLSTLCAVLLYLALRPALERSGLLDKK